MKQSPINRDHLYKIGGDDEAPAESATNINVAPSAARLSGSAASKFRAAGQRVIARNIDDRKRIKLFKSQSNAWFFHSILMTTNFFYAGVFIVIAYLYDMFTWKGRSFGNIVITMTVFEAVMPIMAASMHLVFWCQFEKTRTFFEARYVTQISMMALSLVLSGVTWVFFLVAAASREVETQNLWPGVSLVTLHLVFQLMWIGFFAGSNINDAIYNTSWN